MHVRAVLPEPGPSLDISTDEGRAWVRDVYARDESSYVRLNMITALTGSAVGEDGTSDTLTSRVDREILGVIRAHADAVLVGAATVRAEGYLVPRSAQLAILTASGDLGEHRLSDDAERVLLVCPSDRAEEVRARAALPGARVVPVDDAGALTPPAIVAALAAHGIRRLVCEGGPSVAGMFADAGAIDEYCLTVAPTITPAREPFLRLAADTRPATEVAGMLVDDAGFSYLRLRVRS